MIDRVNVLILKIYCICKTMNRFVYNIKKEQVFLYLLCDGFCLNKIGIVKCNKTFVDISLSCWYFVWSLGHICVQNGHFIEIKLKRRNHSILPNQRLRSAWMFEVIIGCLYFIIYPTAWKCLKHTVCTYLLSGDNNMTKGLCLRVKNSVALDLLCGCSGGEAPVSTWTLGGMMDSQVENSFGCLRPNDNDVDSRSNPH